MQLISKLGTAVSIKKSKICNIAGRQFHVGNVQLQVLLFCLTVLAFFFFMKFLLFLCLYLFLLLKCFNSSTYFLKL